MSGTTSSHSIVTEPSRLFIDGEWVLPSGGQTLRIINPATEELYLEVAAADDTDVDRAVAAAREAFDHGPWPRMTHAERAVFLSRIAERIGARADAFADLWTNQMGVLRAISGQAVLGIPPLFDYYAGLAETFNFSERVVPATRPGHALLLREPVGVVAAIVAWNFPIFLIALKVAPALLSGCTVIVKASPQAPGEAYLLAEIMQEIGLPKGVFNVIAAELAASEALVRHPGVDKVAFTGSTAAGRRIASICGDRMARYTMELGGKSAAIVLDDADVAKVTATMTGEVCAMSGQVCASLTRLIVTPQRHDEVVEALAAAYGRVKIGDPFASESQIGPLAMERQRDRVEHYVAQANEQGARLVVGGSRPSNLNRGYYFEPTLFDTVTNDMVTAQEEIFGPVTCVIRARDEDEAVAIANDSPFGLNATVFTEDNARAHRLARLIRSGTVGHNSNGADVSVAFGGFKQSGIGREGGEEGLRSYLETKFINIETEAHALI